MPKEYHHSDTKFTAESKNGTAYVMLSAKYFFCDNLKQHLPHTIYRNALILVFIAGALLTAISKARAQDELQNICKIQLNTPITNILELDPEPALESDKGLCTKYGYCIFKLKKVADTGFDNVKITTFQDIIIAVQADKDITSLKNPPCDAYAFAMNSFGKPIRKRVTEAFFAGRGTKYKKDGYGYVEVDFSSEKFENLCNDCKIDNTHESIFVVNLTYPKNISIIIDPDKIHYLLKDAASESKCVIAINDLKEKDRILECSAAKETAKTWPKPQKHNGD